LGEKNTKRKKRSQVLKPHSSQPTLEGTSIMPNKGLKKEVQRTLSWFPFQVGFQIKPLERRMPPPGVNPGKKGQKGPGKANHKEGSNNPKNGMPGKN